ncbi:membrane-associated phospholipid phosphatase [Mycobacterium sp. MAA66]|uniref:PA-phosphatase n=1 Tax=Mycobacterium sp. MAA66 TaxID=3156297 RepID=UPI003514F4BA
MSAQKFVRWWPPVGLLAMVFLGLAVGKSSTPIDDVFQQGGRVTQPYSGWLLFFTDPRVLIAMLVIAVAITLWHKRWRLAAVLALGPQVAVLIERGLKQLFGRHKGGALAYPSGHTVLMVTVLGLIVVAAGAVLWSRVLAGIFVALGMLGQAMTYHYFTDTVGAVLFGSALVCLAAWAAGAVPSSRNAAHIRAEKDSFSTARE